MAGGWTEERVTALRQLWLDGHSASQCAARLGEVTRNAVIGKVHRLGLPGRRTTRSATGKPPRRCRPRITVRFPRPPSPPRTPLAPARRLAARTDETEPLMLLFAALQPHQCRWPIGDPRLPGFAFCGRAARGSYCEGHSADAINPGGRRYG